MKISNLSTAYGFTLAATTFLLAGAAAFILPHSHADSTSVSASSSTPESSGALLYSADDEHSFAIGTAKLTANARSITSATVDIGSPPK